MTIQNWSGVVIVAAFVLLALGPWMFMIHAKLAVIATSLGQLGEAMEVKTKPEAMRIPEFDGISVRCWACDECVLSSVKWDGDVATCLGCGRTNEKAETEDA